MLMGFIVPNNHLRIYFTDCFLYCKMNRIVYLKKQICTLKNQCFSGYTLGIISGNTTAGII